MAFLLNGNPLAVGVAFTDPDTGIQYPRNWLQLATAEEKEAIGITEVADAEPYNADVYVGRDSDGNLIEKPLDDVPSVDDDGNPILDGFGNQRVSVGLKNQWIAKQKQEAANLLRSTDWYAVRKAETDTAIPADVATYRANVRTVSGTRESEINACTTATELIALVTAHQFVLNDAGETVTNTEPFLTPWPEAL